MSLKSIWKSITGKNTVATILEMTDAQKAVAALKQTSIGGAIAADISALSSSTLSGPEKFEAVVKNTLPLIVGFLGDNGLKKGVDEVADIGRELVQSVFNTVASKKADTIGSLILKLLNLK